MAIVRLTRRAMDDLHGIDEYSSRTFGRKTADRYLDDIQSAFTRLAEHPGMLRSKDGVSKFFSFYPAGKHYLVCTRIKAVVLVLAIKHSHIDLPERLLTLEPILEREAALLYETVKRGS